jgi:glycosyltransferase involved in cell wall biosynthesis/GT2 family glycosyltransferase
VQWIRPLDWTRGAGRPRAVPPERVDVIVPVYGAPAELAACLASVVANTDLARHRVVLVVDGPQDAAVEAAIAEHAASVDVLRNDERLGFAASVNRGMAASSTDVVLLNSDTIVTARWLEKLIDAAYASGDVGTVTPLSNDATLCSVPRAFAENLLPSGYDVASFAALVERVSLRARPLLPTGVGFCLYIRRALIDDIGLFDARRFGAGYGEENDFCMRALARGWLHVADDATFIYHAGHRSFGASRAERQRRAAAALRRAYRRYDATIADFMRRDPLAPVRARIESALRPARSGERLRVVHLVHGWPPFQHAGTELYAYWLAHRQAAVHDVAVYARGADPARADGEAVEWLDGGMRVRLVTNHFTARDPLRRNAIRDRALECDFERFLREERPRLLHVHHLAGHAFSLVRVARRLGIPIVLQIQDWWFVCARVNRFHRDGVRCAGPAPEKCARCVTLTRVPPAPLTNRVVHALRRRAARAALRAADAFIAGSNAIRDDYASVVPRATPFHVLPYGVAMRASHGERPPTRGPIRFGYVGSIAPHKGVHVAAEAMRGLDATLHVWGDADAYPEYVAAMPRGANVVFEGRFAEEEKPRVYAAMDVLLVPSIGLESFGLAPREAMAVGVPVIATAGGALSEMFAPDVCGDFVPPGDVIALRALLQCVIDDPSIVDRWRTQLRRPKSDEVHAEEIERVYRAVLGSGLR